MYPTGLSAIFEYSSRQGRAFIGRPGRARGLYAKEVRETHTM